ncbi:MAG: division/cell wall cluster transcriptional repressor MraZ [Acidobacteria bacterium]|nr:division/cell wall cluster transcriptional repressor MraZ [Acidobacteriota bacterium]
MFRGQFTAKIDEKERFKLPAAFRKSLSDDYSDDVFITSMDGQVALLYPLQVWNEIEERISRLPKMNPSKERFLRITNYFGLQSKLDTQGRTSLPQALKESAELNGDVVVMGMQDHFEIWNKAKFESKMTTEPFTDEDRKILEEEGL